MSPNAGEGDCGVSANEYSCAHGAQINFGYPTPYLPYGTNRMLLPLFRAMDVVPLMGNVNI
jgi:hypothetical protein